MARYAESTSVSAEKSRGEIERILQRYGADMFSYGWEGRQAAIQFAAKGRRIRFLLPLPDKADKQRPERARAATGRSSSSQRTWPTSTPCSWPSP